MTRIRKAVISAILSTVVVATLLLVPAGLIANQWTWSRGLWAVGVLGGGALVAQLALAIWRPDSFDVRMQAPVARRDQRQPWLDAVGLVAYMAFLGGWCVFLPWDVFRLQLITMPLPAISGLGLMAMIGGQAVSYGAVWQNAFAAPTVHDQTSDGQRVIDTGIYGVVRHPLYAGNLVTFSGLAVWLGSYAALAGVAVMLAFTVARIGIEERELRQRLPSYAEYARRVRARLIPNII